MRSARLRIAVSCSVALAIIETVTWLGFPASGNERGAAQRLGAPTVSVAPASTISVAPATTLPWPREGQAAVEVEGVGSLGSSGAPTPVPIASVTKVMTAYVILADHPLAQGKEGPAVTVDATAAAESLSPDESTAPVREGQKFTERQLLELLLIPSGNNIARLLARWDSGSQEAFVARMNRTAVALGMTRTTYTGASGIEASTRSTAVDQLKLAHEVMKNPALREIVAIRSTTVPGVPGTVDNTNTLLTKPGVIGLKTGSSTPAGGALMWAAHAWTSKGADRRLVLGVVLHQRPGTTPSEGLHTALTSSDQLISAVQRGLPPTFAAHRG
ncbi:D-alanyl-D-alanine carboxypeptidase [Streptomyces pathocidini]|uniref:D-alanyl-D-alanine carboxypeptidase family protein n=1 Tax=Streptomyces pathocidini TaxID=1650571 RepID=UPI0034004465